MKSSTNMNATLAPKSLDQPVHSNFCDSSIQSQEPGNLSSVKITRNFPCSFVISFRENSSLGRCPTAKAPPSTIAHRNPSESFILCFLFNPSDYTCMHDRCTRARLYYEQYFQSHRCFWCKKKKGRRLMFHENLSTKEKRTA